MALEGIQVKITRKTKLRREFEDRDTSRSANKIKIRRRRCRATGAIPGPQVGTYRKDAIAFLTPVQPL
jgi:hypothetical protein